LRDLIRANVRFCNRPFGVKRFQTIHRDGVDVAHGLVLLGAEARRNDCAAQPQIVATAVGSADLIRDGCVLGPAPRQPSAVAVSVLPSHRLLFAVPADFCAIRPSPTRVVAQDRYHEGSKPFR
jgi:hypothetical protein